MKPGDMLVFYTDGIVETGASKKQGAREEFGIERLLEVARADRDRPAAEIVDGDLRRRSRSSRGERPAKDDRTVVVVRYPPA